MPAALTVPGSTTIASVLSGLVWLVISAMLSEVSCLTESIDILCVGKACVMTGASMTTVGPVSVGAVAR